jgi:hypothetical protein
VFEHPAALANNPLGERRAMTDAIPSTRRFPPPWFVDETEACFIVRDHNGQALAYIYFDEEKGRRAAAKLLTRDDARSIAAEIAKLPELLIQTRGTH